MRRALFFGVSMVAAGLVLASCGGGEKATPTPSLPQPTATRAAATAPTATTRPVATVAPAATPTPAPTPRPAATPTPAAAQPTGRLRVAIGTFSFEQFEPSGIDSVGFGAISAPLFDWLLWVDREGKLTPGVAQTWEMGTDAKSWTYTLRPMSFHNGDQLTAADVKFSIERVVRPESHSSNTNPWRAILASIDVLSPQSVRVNAKTPWLLMS
ncbi:MAG: hypothetical protein HYX97_05460, partial [Chloroflexi bacterium]|nr:hypothetical protein [Chloroflexota bacterium]